MDLVLVDGPNLVNVVGRCLVAAGYGGAAAKYLRSWFDVDRLVQATLESEWDKAPTLGTVIFHSRKSLGGASSAYRLHRPDELDAFWGRQGGSPNTSTMLIEIPGSQQEEIECEKCRHRNLVTNKEKGVDTAIASYMFETAASWTTLCLFAKDEDYVPPVLSLRRQGKRVFVSHDNIEHATGLVRACQSFLRLETTFLLHDVAAFTALHIDGAVDQMIDELRDRCQIEIVLAASRTPPKLEVMGQLMRIIFSSAKMSWDEVSTVAKKHVAAVSGFENDFNMRSLGAGRGEMLLGGRALVGVGLERHLAALGEPRWSAHVRADELVI